MANLSSAATNVTDSTKREFFRKALSAKQDLEAAQREAKAASGHYRSILKDAKKAGVSTDAITFALASRHMESDDLLKEQQERMRMLALSGIMPTIQTTLFATFDTTEAEIKGAANEINADRAYDDGFFGGNGGKNRDTNPHIQGSEEFDAWDRGWLLGQEKIVRSMAPKETKARKPRKGKLTVEGRMVAEPVLEAAE